MATTDETPQDIDTRIDWQKIGAELRKPFNPQEVDFRVQGRANEQTGKAQVVAYIDARMVQDRLDDVVGAGNWAFDWEPVILDKGDVQVAKGTLTIHGVSKSDAGTASNFEASLGAVSHCFKRAAVHWGIGRYLYDLPMNWAQVEKNGRISEQLLRELRAKLPRPDGQPQQVPQQATQPTPTALAAHPANDHDVPRWRRAPLATPADLEKPANERQIENIRKLCAALAKEPPTGPLTYAEAGALIATLSEEYKQDSVERARGSQHASVPSAAATPADPDETSQEPADADAQADLVDLFRERGYNTQPRVNRLLSSVIRRVINVADLMEGNSDLTLGELARVQREILRRDALEPLGTHPN